MWNNYFSALAKILKVKKMGQNLSFEILVIQHLEFIQVQPEIIMCA